MWPFSSFKPAFRKQAEECFAFLTEEYGFSAPTYRDKDWWEKTLVYKNATTAVVIKDEFYNTPGIYVILARLNNGQLPPVPLFISLEKSLEEFYLDDVVDLHNPSESGLPNDKKGLPTLAALTRKYGAKILRGDFSEFPALEALVRRRAREIASR